MSTAEANQRHWSNTSKSYIAQPGYEKVSSQIRANLISNASWLGLSSGHHQTTTIIDYACGPGTAGLSLLDYADTIIGIDSAEGMVEQFNSHCQALDLDCTRYYGIHADLLQASLPTEVSKLYGTADVVLCSVGFHHFDYPESSIAKLLHLLKPGGRLVIIDFLKHDNFGQLGDAQSTIGHGAGKGFTATEVKNIFEHGGCIDVQVREWQPEISGGQGQFVFNKNGKEMRFDCFTCCGVKPCVL